MPADERLRCWALGVRVRETVEYVTRNARELTVPMGETERETRIGLLSGQVSNLGSLLRQSEACGTADLGVIRADFERLRDALDRKPLIVNRFADDFALLLHNEALEQVVGGGTVNEEGIVPDEHTSYHRAMIGGGTPPGKYTFIDAERWWESHDQDARAGLLSRITGFAPEVVVNDARRSYGELGGETQDALDGYFTSHPGG